MQNSDQKSSFLPFVREILLPEVLYKYRDEWNRDNCDALIMNILGGIALSGFGIFLAVTKEDGFNLCTYVIFLSIFTGYLVFFLFFRKTVEKHPLFYAYLLCALIFLADIMLETSYGKSAVFLFCLFQIIVPVCYVDLPLRIFLFEAVFSGLYLYIDSMRKPEPMLRLDVSRILLGLIASFIVYSFLIYRRNRLTDSVGGTRVIASRDALTGIYNRGAGESRISELVSSAVFGTFVLMDIDNFKQINDRYGHTRGDEALQAVAAVLAASFRNTDIVMRMGGDEFMVYAIGMLDPHYVERKMTDIRESIHEIELDEKTGEHVTVSAGCLINAGRYHTYEDMYEAADQLLYRAKQRGKDWFEIADRI